jgi:hypothetical protein
MLFDISASHGNIARTGVVRCESCNHYKQTKSQFYRNGLLYYTKLTLRHSRNNARLSEAIECSVPCVPGSYFFLAMPQV